MLELADAAVNVVDAAVAVACYVVVAFVVEPVAETEQPTDAEFVVEAADETEAAVVAFVVAAADDSSAIVAETEAIVAGAEAAVVAFAVDVTAALADDAKFAVIAAAEADVVAV